MRVQERRGTRSCSRALGALLALVFLSFAGPSAAQVITFTSASASWRNAVDNVPGSQPGDPVITNGVPTSSISWGGSTPQSGYDVTITIPDPNQFPVANFTHRNFTVPDPSLVSVVLDIVIDFDVDGVQTGPLLFTFSFTHEETPNNLNPCPYPTPPGEGCTDRVTFLDAPLPTTFTVGGKTYTLGLTFLDDMGNPVDEFITSEGGVANNADLDVEFALVPPVFEVIKSGPGMLAPGQAGVFRVDAQNTGPNEAFNTTIRDVLPDGPTGGMCDATPQVLSARVFAADGFTPVPGKGPLVQGTDFAFSYTAAPSCELVLTMLSAASVVDENERLVITYQTQLDGGTQFGAALTNVAGATEWFDDDAFNLGRGTYTETLSDGTTGALDHEDAHTVNTELLDYLFEKTVVDPVAGLPVTTAAPGDTLRYQLRLENRTATALVGVGFRDEIDALNASPLFEPGSLTLVTVPGSANTTGTNPNGGASGTGVVDVRNLSVPPGGSTLVEFDVTLVNPIPSGTLVTDQAELLIADAPLGLSDDPAVNGVADPFVPGDEDPTVVPIGSGPDFQVEKVSAYLDGDPNLLLAGETLRYTITVRNIGDSNALDTVIRDAIPTNTAYVAGSTTLNGAALPDGPGGTAPFSVALPINSPDSPTPGVMLAGGTDPGRTATLTFDVVVDPLAPDGTVISNQAFVSAPGPVVTDQPSDDPDTPTVDDPTRDVVGNSPLLFAPKSAMLLIDNPPIGQVDPGDVLLYTIEVRNDGPAVATDVVLTDGLPAGTNYLQNTTILNGAPIGVPDGGVFPLIAGLPISSNDLAPPGPGPSGNTISIDSIASVTFQLEVDPLTPPGTIITNQATVDTTELPTVLTDGDGDPATGPEPTVVVVGPGQELAIDKTVTVAGGGPALAGSTVEYVVRVTNIGTTDAQDVVITDDLDMPVAGQMTLVANSAVLNGNPLGVSVAGSVITADYSTNYGPLPPGAEVTLRFRADLDVGLPMGTNVTNTGNVDWNAATQSANASVTFAIGGVPGVGLLRGSVWHDANFDGVQGLGEIALAAWFVDLERNDVVVATTTTETSGAYQFSGVAPNDTNGDVYVLRFRAPDAGANTGSLGTGDSPYTNGPQSIGDIPIASGGNLIGLNLPIDPNGVVYDVLARSPVAGAAVQLLSATSQTPVSSACFDDPAQQGQVTGSRGYYKFDLTFGDGSCPSGGDYLVQVIPPSGSFATGTSAIIPPQTDATTAPFDVPSCPGGASDAVPATAQRCEVQTSELAPPTSVLAGSAGTAYRLHLTLDATSPPGTSQLFNNHIALDPVLGGAVSITKTTPKINVSRGDLVPYEIVFNNALAVPLTDLTLFDRYPAGFRYVEGSARVDGVEIEPTVNGRVLEWTDLGIEAASSRTVVLLLAVGAGVTEGEFVNRAQVASSTTGLAYSGEATATVRVVPDPTFDCTDVLGKVFDDANRDGIQNQGEVGLPGVRLMTVRGLAITTDPYGRFHITCAIVPNERRGSNFVLKLDDRTLPSGYRMSTRQTQVKRATRGKALEFTFGAAIHRVVGLDMADAVFEPGSIEIRVQWKPSLDMLLDELEKQEAILRLSYIGDVEDEDLVKRRVDAVKDQIEEAWKDRGGSALTIETEIFWRGGAPPSKRPRMPRAETPVSTPRESSAVESKLPHVGAGPPRKGPPGPAGA